MDQEKLERAPGVISEPAGDKVMLINAAGDKITTLNPVGSLIWAEVEQPRSVEQIIDALKTRFPDQDAERIETDVQAFVAKLCEVGLLTAVG